MLIFTEFADTARYLRSIYQLRAYPIVGQMDSASQTNRADMIQRFSPYYNGETALKLDQPAKRKFGS